MATRYIESPGVQITERDLSNNASLPTGTGVLVCGYAPQGPSDVLIEVTSKGEFVDLFFGVNGATNAAERYFYQSGLEVLNSPARLLVTRIPYDVAGSDEKYSALMFPVSSTGTSGIQLFSSATSFSLGTPTVSTLTQSQYNDLKYGSVTWSASSNPAASSLGDFAMVIVNKAKTNVNEYYEGMYVTITDNTQHSATNSPSAVNAVFSVNSSNASTALASTQLTVALTGVNSVSESVQNSIGYDFTLSNYNDAILISLYKMSLDTLGNDPVKLIPTRIENFVGSFDYTRQQASSLNGQQQTFFIGDVVNNGSQYLDVYVNRNFSSQTNFVSANQYVTTIRDVDSGLRGFGTFQTAQINSSSKQVGNLPLKLERALALAENRDYVDMDIVVEAGLGTIWSMISATGTNAFDDEAVQDISGMYVQEGSSATPAVNYRTIFNVFENFASQTRKDCVYIADPLRSIFVSGKNGKVLDRKTDRNFTEHIYNPLRNLYGPVNTNYGMTYGNWIYKYDTGTQVNSWIPFSAWEAAIMARMDAALFPWMAPAGLTNGIVRNITDIAINPNQKQRDMLYRIGVNPVVYFPQDGFTVWGQKTLQSKPSAFDRINVRRLFLTLEKATERVARYFVMEPNTVFSRTRLTNSLKPIFDLAKQNEGVYDYIIICDERNNTPQVIDDNTLKVDVYIKPVRTAEFILIEFIATRTGQDFNELV